MIMNCYRSIGYYINIFFNIIGVSYLVYAILDYWGFNFNLTLVKALVIGFGAVIGFIIYGIIQSRSKK